MCVTVANRPHVVLSRVVHILLQFVGHNDTISVNYRMVDKLPTAVVLGIEWPTDANPIDDRHKHC